MAQANYTPIQLYRSTTASAVPTSGNLADGELAINTNDGKLYYKDSGGIVQLIASKAGASGDVVGPASATDNAIVRFDGTTGKLVQNSVVTIADSTGDISGVGQLNATTVDATNVEVTNIKAKDGTAAASIADSTGVVTVTAAPVMTALTASQAVFTTAGKALTSNAITGTGNVVMSASPTLTGTIAGASLQLSSLTSGRVTYAGASGLLQDSANLLYSGTDLTVYGITVGRGAGAVATNTAVGASALAANTTGALSVAVGYYALQANTSGDRNHAIGYASMYTNTTGNYNTVCGYAGLYANTTGSLNTALGYACLVQNTTGASNVAVGHETLQGNTTANANTSVGYRSAYSNTTGSNGAVLGYQALYSNTTGTRNTAIGNAAMYSNTTANDNTGVGANALPANTTGANNVAVGSSALQSNTTASNNTAVGYQALYSSNATGNTAFGHSAGDSLTSGGFNTMLGYLAGADATTGTYNTFVGVGAGQNVSTGGKNTILGGYSGNQGGLDIRTLSNRIVLSDGDGNPRWYIDDTGAAGYGPTTGGAVTQATSRTTGVTLNKPTGAITLVSAAGTTSWQSFTVTNNTVAATDTIIVSQKSGTDLYQIFVTNVAAGSFQITFATTGGTTTEQPVFNFALIKGQTT